MKTSTNEPQTGSFTRVAIAGVILALVTGLAAVFGLGGPAQGATSSTTTDPPACGSYKWDRTYVPTYVANRFKQPMPATPGVKQYKFEKTVKDFKIKYQYQKETRTKVKHGNAPWEPYGNWSWWSPPSYQWSYNNVDVLEGPAQHGSGTYSHNGHTDQWYREYRYVKNGNTESVQTGSHQEYYVPGGASSLTNTDANWTTDTPGSPWVKIAGVERYKPGSEPQPAYNLYYVQGGTPSRNEADASWVRQGQGPGSPWQVFGDPKTFNDTPVYETYGYSVNEPPRGAYPNVPWNKIPGTQVDCPNPVDPAVEQTICVNGVPSTPTVTPATSDGSYTLNPAAPYAPGQTVVVTRTWVAPEQQPATLPAGWVKTSATTATFTVVLGKPDCTTTTTTPPPVPPTTTPPPATCPPGQDWNDDGDNVVESGECNPPEVVKNGKGTVLATCVSPTRGEGVAWGKMSAANTVAVGVLVKQGKKVLAKRTVNPSKFFRIQLKNVKVNNKAVKLYIDGKLVDKDKVEKGCKKPVTPHVGLRQKAKQVSARVTNSFKAAAGRIKAVSARVVSGRPSTA